MSPRPSLDALLQRALLALALCACGAPPEAAEAPDETRAVADVVQLSAAAIERAQVRVAPVERGAVGGALAFPAEVRPDPAALTHVASMVAGRVVELSVLPGDLVRAGQTLAVLDSADAADLGASLAEARARLGAAQEAVARLDTLGETGVASRRAQIEAEAERDRLRASIRGLSQRRSALGSRGGRTSALVAPRDALVLERSAHLGDVLAVGDAVLTLADPQQVWIVAHLPELRATRVEAGRAVVFRPADGSDAIAATLTRVAPQLDPHTRTLEVVVALSSAQLRPNASGTLELTGDASSLSIPTSALVMLPDGDAVFSPVPGQSGAFALRRVRVGRSAGGRAEILEGLSETDAVVAEGTFTLLGELLRDQIGEE